MINFKQTLARNLLSIPGYRTNRKIVVIESDDWGSIRMSSNKAISAFQKAGINLDRDPYSLYDTLESENDLNALFEVLKKFKDKKGNHPVITANTVMANPDFDKIAASNFKEYHYELFTKTYERYYNSSNLSSLWEEGMALNLFKPQFHGREHVNVALWMNALQSQNERIHLAFKYGVFGISDKSDKSNKRNNYMAAFDFNNERELAAVNKIIKDGLSMFESFFGFKSKSIIAPCYVWSSKCESLLNDMGVKALQGISYQSEPTIGKSKYSKKIRYTGQSNKYGQRFLVRNAFFEPTHFNGMNHITDLLNRMDIAFFWNKPLIIGSHRINYMGTLSEKNRSDNLIKLEILLKSILERHPDVEFMSTDCLVDLMLTK